MQNLLEIHIRRKSFIAFNMRASDMHVPDNSNFIETVCRIVFPMKTQTGAYAELKFTSSCQQGKKYDRIADSCA